MALYDSTFTRRLRREEHADDVYGELFDQIKAEQEAEWSAEFDTIPFKPNGAEIHQVVTRRMSAMTEAA